MTTLKGRNIESLSFVIEYFADTIIEISSYIARDVQELNALKMANKKRALKHLADGISILKEIDWIPKEKGEK